VNYSLDVYIVMFHTHNMDAFQCLCGFPASSLGESGNAGFKCYLQYIRFIINVFRKCL